MNESRDQGRDLTEGREVVDQGSMPNNGCSWVRSQLPRFVDGELTELVTDEISAHLALCPHCQEELEATVAETLRTVEGLVEAEPSAELAARIGAELAVEGVRSATPRLWIPSAAAAALLLTTGLLAWIMSTPLGLGPNDSGAVERGEVAHQSLPLTDAPSQPVNAGATENSKLESADAGSENAHSENALPENAQPEDLLPKDLLPEGLLPEGSGAVTVSLPPRGSDEASFVASTPAEAMTETESPTAIVVDGASLAAVACDAGPRSSVVRGDVDADGAFTQHDVLLLSAAIEKGPQVVRCAAAADFDGDDQLTPRDVGDALFALNIRGSAPCFELREGSSLACDLAMCP